jgi:hypothetical protein
MQSKSGVTLNEVRNLKKPAETFLCEVGANHYSLQFLEHSISNNDNGKEYFSFR